MDAKAAALATTCESLPYFSHALELMIHSVLEDEKADGMLAKRSSRSLSSCLILYVGLPESLLPRVIEFIMRFPEYLEVIAHCARKTEVCASRTTSQVSGIKKQKHRR